jgi:hypothetical protein
MKQNPVGTRYEDYKLYEKKLNQPYDYSRNGLLNKILPNRIVNSKNTIFKEVLNYFEKMFIYLMKYVDKLKHFKNYNAINR